MIEYQAVASDSLAGLDDFMNEAAKEGFRFDSVLYKERGGPPFNVLCIAVLMSREVED